MAVTSTKLTQNNIIANQSCYCNFIRGLLRARKESVIDEDSIGECIKICVQKNPIIELNNRQIE